MMKQPFSDNKSRVTMEDRLPLILCFLLPMVVMLGVFAGKEIYPFGDNSFLRTDMYHQYAPFFANFARILKEGGSLTYSTEIGLGSNYVALYAYYLSSPFNWLLILIPAGAVVEFMTYLIVVKIGLCGLTMGLYLRRKFRHNGMELPIISIFYALSGYMAAYSWNIMWLDCLWLAPLILLGIEQLVRRNQPFLYCITLGLAIISNYYISIMLCIFCVLYFVCEMILLQQRPLRDYITKLIVFSLFSLLAGGLSAFLLLPAYRCLMTTASADSTFPTSLTSYFSVLEMLARHMINVECETGLDHWPNLYSGVGCMLLLPMYLLNPRIKSRGKIVKISLLGVMLASFALNIPNYIWHGMHYPNSLPCRQSFLYTILLLTMCYEALIKMRDLTKHQVLACFWGDAAFILICQAILKLDDFEYHVYYLSLIFLALYVLLIYLVKEETIRHLTALILALALVVVEGGINTAVTSVTTTSRSEYWNNTDNYQYLLQQAQDQDTSGFFRVEKPSRKTKNDGAWTDYSSASLFSSTTQASISDFYKAYGMEGNTNAYSFTGATPLMSSLLSVRYLITTATLPDSPLYSYAGWQGPTSLYCNNYTMPLGFMVPSSAAFELTPDEGDSPARMQNALVEATAGTGRVLIPIEECYDEDEFFFEVTEAGHIFVFIEGSSPGEIRAYVNEVSKTFSNVDRGYFLDLGYCTPGTEISVTSNEEEVTTLDATAYRFDDKAFLDWYAVMMDQPLEVNAFTDSLDLTEVNASIYVKEDGTLFTSIPYDEGWTVLVDDAETETMAFADAFLSVPLTAGEHVITMTYHVPGFQSGILLSLACLIILATLFIAVWLHRNQLRSARPAFISSRTRRNSNEIHHPGKVFHAEKPSRDTHSGMTLPPTISDTEEEEDPFETVTPEPQRDAAPDSSPDAQMTDDELAEILLEDDAFLEPPEVMEYTADDDAPENED